MKKADAGAQVGGGQEPATFEPSDDGELVAAEVVDRRGLREVLGGQRATEVLRADVPGVVARLTGPLASSAQEARSGALSRAQPSPSSAAIA